MSVIEISATPPSVIDVNGQPVQVIDIVGLGAQVRVGGGLQPFEHNQPAAASLWTINHNLNRWPASVSVLSVGGVEMLADVTHISINQCTVAFASPTAGVARII